MDIFWELRLGAAVAAAAPITKKLKRVLEQRQVWLRDYQIPNTKCLASTKTKPDADTKMLCVCVCLCCQYQESEADELRQT